MAGSLTSPTPNVTVPPSSQPIRGTQPDVRALLAPDTAGPPSGTPTFPIAGSSPPAAATVPTSPANQVVGSGASTANQTITLGFTPTTGNLLVLCYARSGGLATGAVTSVTDTGGNTWKNVTRGAVSGGSNTRIELWITTVTANPGTITVNSGTAQTNAWNVTEWAGLDTSAAQGFYDFVSPDGSTTASSTTLQVPPLLAQQGFDLLIVAAHYAQATESGLTSGWTALTDFPDAAVGSGIGAYQAYTAGSATVAGPSWTLATAHATGYVAVAFRGTPTAAGPTGTVQMDGTGALAVGQLQTEPYAVSMAGAGSLTVTGSQAQSGAVSMAGAGALAVAGTSTGPASVTMAGAGALAVGQAQTIPSTVTMAGAGALAVTPASAPAMPSLIGTVAADDASALTTRNITVPTGVTTAHLGLILVGSASGSQPVPTITGWAALTGLSAVTATNESWTVFKRLGGQTAGDTITITTSGTAEILGILGVWLDTGGKDIDVIGSPTVRSSSVATTVAASLTTTQWEAILVVSTERTTATGTTVSSISPADVTTLAYHEGTTGANVSHFIGYFDPGAAGATAAHTLTYSGASTNGGAVQLSVLPNAAAPVDSGAVTMAGAGALAVGQAQTEPYAVALAGAGGLAVGQAQTIPSAVGMAGAGALAVSAGASAAVAMAGTGALAVAGLKTISGTVGMAGAGALAVGQAQTEPYTVLMAGAGALTVVALTPVMRFLANTPMYVAHRGGSADWDEETLYAYSQAAAWNPDLALEVSVWQSSDGVWVASHDQTTGRVFSGTSLDIPTNTWATLSSKVTIASGLPIARLDDILAKWANGSRRVFFIDNKGQTAISNLLTLLASYGGPDRFILKGFYSSTTWASAAASNGYQSWGYWFPADTSAGNLTSTTAANWTMLGIEYDDTSTIWTQALGYGKPVLAHIIATAAQKTTALTTDAANGIMASGVVEAVPNTATTGVVAMAGAGALAVAGTKTIPSTVSMAGAGALTVTPGDLAAVSMAGTGSLAVGQSQTEPGAVTMAGAGSLAVTQAQTEPYPVTMAGAGALTVGTAHTIPAAVALAGAGALAVGQAQTIPSVVGMAGAGVLIVTSGGLQSGTVTMAGAGSLAVGQAQTIPGTVTFAGAGVLAVAGSKSITAAVAMTGSGTLTVTGSLTITGSITLTGNGTLAVGQAQTVPSAVGMAGAGALAVAAQGAVSGTVAMAGAGTLTVGQAQTVVGAIGMTGSSTLTVAGADTITATIALTGTGTLTVGQTQTQPYPVAMAGTGTLAVGQAQVVLAALALAGAGVLTVGQSQAVPGTVTLAGAGTLAVGATVARVATVTLTGTGALAIAGTTVGQNAVAMSGLGALLVAGLKTTTSTVGMAGTGGLSIAGLALLNAAVLMTGAGTLGIIGQQDYHGRWSVWGGTTEHVLLLDKEVKPPPVPVRFDLVIGRP